MPGVVYRPSRTCAEFITSPKPYVGIRGPVGAGKSVACCARIVKCSCEQVPGTDGVRRSRWLIMRNTLPELRDTTIKTWLSWFPQTEMNWTPPYHGHLVMGAADGGKVDIELVFYGCDQPDFEEKLKALEITGVWVDEACQVRFETIAEAFNRCGRYPKKEPGKRFRSFGVTMCTNPPDDSNWWYTYAEVKKPPEMDFFAQPPALIRREGKDGEVFYEDNIGQVPGIPPAENIENLNEGFLYYRKQLVASSEDAIRRLVLNQYGTSIEGKPVYPEWNDKVHWAGKVLPINFGLPILFGQDFGRTPACVIGQMTTDGRFVILEEVLGENMGITQFVQDVLRPLFVNKYRLLEGSRIVGFADPAGGRPDELDEVTCVDRMRQNGINVVPCPGLESNSFVARRECVSDLLRTMRDGKPGILVSSECTELRKGFNGGYCYKRMRGQNGGDDRYANSPDKHNKFTHPHDALQYLVWGAMHSGESFSTPNSMGGSIGQHRVGGLDLGPFGF